MGPWICPLHKSGYRKRHIRRNMPWTVQQLSTKTTVLNYFFYLFCYILTNLLIRERSIADCDSFVHTVYILICFGNTELPIDMTDQLKESDFPPITEQEIKILNFYPSMVPHFVRAMGLVNPRSETEHDSCLFWCKN